MEIPETNVKGATLRTEKHVVLHVKEEDWGKGHFDALVQIAANDDWHCHEEERDETTCIMLSDLDKAIWGEKGAKWPDFATGYWEEVSLLAHAEGAKRIYAIFTDKNGRTVEI